jgi:hypothetical protein
LKIRVPGLELCSQKDGENWWLRMEQISQVHRIHWKIGKREEMCGGKSGCIVDRDSLGIKLASSVTPVEWTLHPLAMVEVLLALAVRYVLDPSCGDSGLWNLLVRTSDWTVWCIDYEEERNEDSKRVNTQWTAPLSTRSWTQDRLEVFEVVRGMTGLRKRWEEIEKILEDSKGAIPFKFSRVEEIRVSLSIPR